MSPESPQRARVPPLRFRLAPYTPSKAAQMAFHTTHGYNGHHDPNAWTPGSVSLNKRCHLSSGGGDYLCEGNLVCTFPASF